MDDKTTPRMREAIRSRHRAGESVPALADDYGLSRSIVRRIIATLDVEDAPTEKEFLERARLAYRDAHPSKTVPLPYTLRDGEELSLKYLRRLEMAWVIGGGSGSMDILIHPKRLPELFRLPNFTPRRKAGEFGVVERFRFLNSERREMKGMER